MCPPANGDALPGTLCDWAKHFKLPLCLPVPLSASSQVALPVLQCGQCGETDLDSTTMKRVDELLAVVDGATELGVIRYAA